MNFNWGTYSFLNYMLDSATLVLKNYKQVNPDVFQLSYYLFKKKSKEGQPDVLICGLFIIEKQHL